MAKRSEHRRKSLRLTGFDYRSPGAYFITICVNNRLALLGAIRDGGFEETEAGLMVESWWNEIPGRFSNAFLDRYVVMPNHFHGIVIPGPGSVANGEGKHGGLPLQLQRLGDDPANTVSLPRIMQWFKSITTADYRYGVKHCSYPPFEGRLWQRNYYEHIARSDLDLDRIHHYIDRNVADWQTDTENPMKS